MDGRTLMDIMQSPNWAMQGMAEDAFKRDQQAKQASIAQTQANTKNSLDKLPYEIDHQKALTRQGNSNADAVDLANAPLKGMDPQLRVDAASAGLRDKMGAQQQAQRDQAMHALNYYTTMAKNRGLTPEEHAEINKTYPGMGKFFQNGDTLKAAERAYEDYIRSSSKYALGMDQTTIKTQSAERIAAARASAAAIKASMRVGGGGRAPKPGDSGELTPEAIQYNVSRLRGDPRAILGYMNFVIPRLKSMGNNELATELEKTLPSVAAIGDTPPPKDQSGKVDLKATTNGRVTTTPQKTYPTTTKTTDMGGGWQHIQK